MAAAADLVRGLDIFREGHPKDFFNGDYSRSVNLVTPLSCKQSHAVRWMQSTFMKWTDINTLVYFLELQHSSIPEYTDVFMADGEIFLLCQPMNPLLPGGKAYIDTLSSEREFAISCRTILEGIHFLHSHSILLSTSFRGKTLFQDQTGCIKILYTFDWYRQPFTCNKEGATVFGDPIYWSAPEVLIQSEEEKESPKADIWCFGAIMYEMLEMRPPFADNPSLMQVFRAILNLTERPKLQDEEKYSKELLAFLSACMIRSVSERPTASELLQFKHPFLTKSRAKSARSAQYL